MMGRQGDRECLNKAGMESQLPMSLSLPAASSRIAAAAVVHNTRYQPVVLLLLEMPPHFLPPRMVGFFGCLTQLVPKKEVTSPLNSSKPAVAALTPHAAAVQGLALASYKLCFGVKRSKGVHLGSKEMLLGVKLHIALRPYSGNLKHQHPHVKTH